MLRRQTARQGWKDYCTRRHLPLPFLGKALSGGLATPAIAPVVKSAAAAANSIAAMLLQKSTTAAASRAMLEVGCSTASTVARRLDTPYEYQSGCQEARAPVYKYNHIHTRATTHQLDLQSQIGYGFSSNLPGKRDKI